jgi:O-antigen/teichoic acid export membrane protein
LDDVWGLVIATVGSSATALVHRVVAVRAFMTLKVPRSEVRAGFRALPEIIRFGLRIAPGGLANGVCNEIGTWTLGITGSVTALGAYSRALILSIRLLEVNRSISEMLFPTLVARRSGGDHAGFDRALVDTLRYCTAGLLLPAAVGGGAAASVMALYGPGFVPAATALALLLTVPAVSTVGGLMRQALLAVDRPWITSVTAIAKLALTAIATIALTLWLGMSGTALGLLVGAVAEAAWIALLTGRYLHSPMRVLWPLRQQGATVLAYVAGFAAARAVVSVVPGVTGLLPALLGGVIAFALTLMAAGGVNDRDRARVAAIIRSRRRSRVAAASPS